MAKMSKKDREALRDFEASGDSYLAQGIEEGAKRFLLLIWGTAMTVAVIYLLFR